MRITDEMRRSSDKVDWDMLTPQSLQVLETALRPRKQEWLIMDAKPVPGSKQQVHDGSWFTGDAALGWAAIPDTEEMPRMVDGTMLEWANINTKLPNQEGYLEARARFPSTFWRQCSPLPAMPFASPNRIIENPSRALTRVCDSHPQVDIEPPSSPDLRMISWDDLPTPPEDQDLVYQHADWEEDGRTAHADLRAGQTLTGVIVDQHLYHGAFVDCGTEYNGCAKRTCVR